MRKKFLIVGSISVLFIVGIVLLFPLRRVRNDGGTVEYRSFLYKIIQYHIIDERLEDGYNDGIEIEIFGISMYRKLDRDDFDYSDEEPNSEISTQVIQVNGILYYNTLKESTIGARCGTMDGYITSHVDSNLLPTVDNQANFEGDYGYQYGFDNTIEVFMNGKWIVFASKNIYFTKTYTVESIKQVDESENYHVALSVFQGEIATVLISQKLESGKTYEFTFSRDFSVEIEDSIYSIFQNSKIVTITETDKVGFDQIQDSIS